MISLRNMRSRRGEIKSTLTLQSAKKLRMTRWYYFYIEIDRLKVTSFTVTVSQMGGEVFNMLKGRLTRPAYPGPGFDTEKSDKTFLLSVVTKIYELVRKVSKIFTGPLAWWMILYSLRLLGPRLALLVSSCKNSPCIISVV